MALSVHSVDGLISRLLHQQNSALQHKNVGQHRASNPEEKVDISQQARETAADQSATKMESHLLQLYNSVASK